MSSYIIEGGKKLKGEISISGNKNSVLPCLAATLLTDKPVILKNVPRISDVEVMVDVLKFLGADVEYLDHEIKVCCAYVKNKKLPQEMVSKLRASILLTGPLLSRFGKAEFFHPGGDVIGRRGIDLHLDGFRQLGFKVSVRDREYSISSTNHCPDVRKIFLEIATVTGTENLIMAAVLKKGTTIIKNAAQEPHVVDLCNLLSLMGAKIEGIGTSTLTIEGVSNLEGAEFTVGSDGIEFGTYAIAAALTGGEITIKNCKDLDLDPLIWPMVKMGVEFIFQYDNVKVKSKKLTAIPRLITNEWPGFPTDLMSVMIVLATQSKGVSLMYDWIYESRMFFVDKLISMGANITIADPHRVLVSGPTALNGRNLETPDIRAGMALVLASLVAKGNSTIQRAELIERGYEDVVKKLTTLGAVIKKIE